MLQHKCPRVRCNNNDVPFRSLGIECPWLCSRRVWFRSKYPECSQFDGTVYTPFVQCRSGWKQKKLICFGLIIHIVGMLPPPHSIEKLSSTGKFPGVFEKFPDFLHLSLFMKFVWGPCHTQFFIWQGWIPQAFLLFTFHFFLGFRHALVKSDCVNDRAKGFKVLFICSLNSGGKKSSNGHTDETMFDWLWCRFPSLRKRHVSSQGPQCLRCRLNDTTKPPYSHCMAVFPWVFIYCFFFLNIFIFKKLRRIKHSVNDANNVQRQTWRKFSGEMGRMKIGAQLWWLRQFSSSSTSDTGLSFLSTFFYLHLDNQRHGYPNKPNALLFLSPLFHEDLFSIFESLKSELQSIRFGEWNDEIHGMNIECLKFEGNIFFEKLRLIC